MNYFMDLSRMSLNELVNLKLAVEHGCFDVDHTNLELLAEHTTFRLESVEKLERALNATAS